MLPPLFVVSRHLSFARAGGSRYPGMNLPLSEVLAVSSALVLKALLIRFWSKFGQVSLQYVTNLKRVLFLYVSHAYSVIGQQDP